MGAPQTAELSAPGKAFLAGEYAVLEPGEPALVLAVDLRLHLSLRQLPGRRVEVLHRPTGAFVEGELRPEGLAWSSRIPGELRFAARAAELAVRLCAEEGRELRGFQAAFEDDLASHGRKLGLGGSAAACVLSVRAACSAQGRATSPPEVQALAGAAHWIEQGGRGSGADVAACALGGLLEVRSRRPWQDVDGVLRRPARDLLAQGTLDARPIRVPSQLRFLLAYSGAPAHSPSLVGDVLAFAEARPGRWRHHVRAISAQEVALREALEREDEAASLEAIRRAAAAMGALGDEAQVGIVTPDLARACAIASSCGAAAKPSGAGGGDCAIVLGWGDAADRTRAALQVAGYLAVEVTPAPA
jgi:phosphomevalonate kinase